MESIWKWQVYYFLLTVQCVKQSAGWILARSAWRQQAHLNTNHLWMILECRDENSTQGENINLEPQ